ncbi:MAG: SpoIIE family protein phosphatase [Mycobacteriaceae bacterium]|nr:SpoIIE family protein phosphatase [Mycobacteriaceae bacterium]MBV9513691.1 SpoIIE family protein phosphatase [Mycobacteriaceae bacterium]
MDEHGWLGPIEWATAGRARPGEDVCGDQSIAVEIGSTAALFGVLDGLGHGAAAQEAAACAIDVLCRYRSDPLDVLIRHCHRALADTRGAAMTLARIDFDADTISWIGIGNVTAALVAKSPSGIDVRSSALLTGGIVGYRLPETLLTQNIFSARGDLLVMASDGIDESHLERIDFAAPTTVIADEILRDHGKDSDDALVLAARHRGALQ